MGFGGQRSDGVRPAGACLRALRLRPDLVEDGINGFTFDPYDVEALAGLMQRVAAMTDERRAAMGQAGQLIIADWGPERFADGLVQAVQAALRRPPRMPSLFDQTLLWALARRPL